VISRSLAFPAPPGGLDFASEWLASACGGGARPGATFTVTNTNDQAPDRRQAIPDANANAGADTIAFNILGAGVQTIAPSSSPPSGHRRSHGRRTTCPATPARR
jgi:hypothetical protein